MYSMFYLCSALDAYCLLEVYDVLKQWVVESRLRINMEPALVLSWLQPKKEKQRYDVTMVTSLGNGMVSPSVG